MNTQVQNLDTTDIDALLDSDYSELLDRKEFEPLPIGTHLFRFGWEKANMEDHDFVGVIFELEHIRPLHLANPQDAAKFEEGGVFHGEEKLVRKVRCYFANSDGKGSNYGQGTAKAVAQAMIDAGLVQANEEGKFPLSYIFDSVTGYEVIGTVAHRKDKQDKTKLYEDFKEIVPNMEVSE